ncbi:MAG: hypothetical protein HYS22_00890 [Deltaproteobacteria bacterium]|nr:hypothetical protein [Deltaproteobacteria bacterium]
MNPSPTHSAGRITTEDEFLIQLAEAAYLVVSKSGFRGSFLAFLCDFKKALDEILCRNIEGLFNPLPHSDFDIPKNSDSPCQG